MKRFVIIEGALPPGFDALEMESILAGHTMLSKLKRSWPAAFPADASLLVAAMEGISLLGIGGIAPDPYVAEARRARIRHLYVADAARRTGVGRRIITRCLDFARARYDVVSLRTPGSAEANAFYETLGFRPLSGDPTASHLLTFPR